MAFKKDKDKQRFIKDNFEYIAHIETQTNFSKTFRFSHFNKVKIKDEEFSNCSENVMLNWISFLMEYLKLYNKGTKKYETGIPKIIASLHRSLRYFII